MRSAPDDFGCESFTARRAANQTGVGAGAAWRNMLFEVFQVDGTDSKILFVPDSKFLFTAKENEVWTFSVQAYWPAAPAVNDQLGVGVQSSVWGTIGLSVFLAATVAAGSYLTSGSITLPFRPGDTLTPIAYSAHASDNNLGGANLTVCSGARVG